MTKDRIEKMVVIASRVAIKAESRDEFLRSTAALLEPTRAEADCLTYLFCEDSMQANHFLFFEEWRSRAGFERHHASAKIKNYEAKIPAWLAETVTVNLYRIKDVTVMSSEPAGEQINSAESE